MYYNKNFSEWGTVQTVTPKSMDEPLYQFRIGSFGEHIGCSSDYDIMMRKSTFDKLLSGDYKVSDNPEYLVILDSCGNEVPKVLPKGVCCEVF